MKELDNLKKLIDENDIISFDIFDTLLLRNVLKPLDIFALVEKQNKVKNFQKKRIKAEADSRKAINDYETTLDAIYQNLSFSDKEILKQKELEIEKDFLIANPFMKKAYDYSIKRKKKVIIISDMYLPKNFIFNVLKLNGYTNIPIYLSCDYKKTKASKKLYEQIEIEEKYNKNKWLHIGDNIYSDIEAANDFGLNTYHYIKVLDRNPINNDNLKNSIIMAIINNYIYNGLDLEKKLDSLFTLIPLYYNYACFIIKNTNSNILYFNEQSLIIKKIIDLIIKYNNLNLMTKIINKEDKNISIINISDNNSKGIKNNFYLISKKMIFNKRVYKKVFKKEYEKYDNLFKNNDLINYKEVDIIIDTLAKYYKYLKDI